MIDAPGTGSSVTATSPAPGTGTSTSSTSAGDRRKPPAFIMSSARPSVEIAPSSAATAGIADALTVGEDGRPVVVVDWKSDVNPDAQTLDHYSAQVSAYLNMTGAERGLIVLMTRGTVIAVSPSPQTATA